MTTKYEQITPELFKAMCKDVMAGRKTRYVIADAGLNHTDFYSKYLNKDKRRKKRWADAIAWKGMGPDERAERIKAKAQAVVDGAIDLMDEQKLADTAKFADALKAAGADKGATQGSGSTYIQHNDNSQHVHVERRITRSVVFSPESDPTRWDLIDVERLDTINDMRNKQVESAAESEASEYRRRIDEETRQRVEEMRDKTRNDDGTQHV